MYVAGDPSLGLVFLTCLGGALSAGGAGAINHAIDRDIDRQMARTADRPVASGRISPARGDRLRVRCSAAPPSLLLSLAVNPLAAALSLSRPPRLRLRLHALAEADHAAEHRHRRRRRGGAAAGRLGGGHRRARAAPRFFLFAIVFFWTPPHFWALSLLMKDEYAKVGVPMLPVVRGEQETRRQILLYTVLLYAVTQLPFCAGGFGVEYLVASMTLGAAFIYCAVRLLRSADRRWALRTYLFSLAYLALLFLSMPLDRVL